jgi:polygalacturonase
MFYDIKDFGAVGDGKNKDTSAIQKAIDECSENGGGRVIVSPGKYLTGTFFLKDNVDLHLMPGAVLLGSPDLSDYNADDCFEQNLVFAKENVTGAHLIIAHEVENVSITGRGCIDGNSSVFFGTAPNESANFSIKDKRPGQMIYFCECKNVLVEGVALNNAPYWTCFIHGCENVSVRGVRISNPPQTQNGDGVDIDCCRNVTISDCIIFSGDDCITLRGNNKTLKNKEIVCENVAISNCVLSTPCNAFRIGVGDGIVRNCVISNIVITETRNGICFISKYSENQKKGTTIENINISNVIMDSVLPFYIAAGLDAIAQIKNIRISNVRATGRKTSCIYGNDNVMLRNVKFKDIDLEMTEGSEYMEDKIIDPCVHREWNKGIDSAFFCARSDDLVFDDVRIRWRGLNAPWKHSFILKDSEKIVMENIDAATPPEGDESENIVSDNVKFIKG